MEKTQIGIDFLKDIRDNNFFSSIKTALAKRYIDSDFSLEISHSFSFKESQIFYSESAKLNVEWLNLDLLTQIDKEIQRESRLKISVQSNYFSGTYNNFEIINYFYNLLDIKELCYSKRFLINIFLFTQDRDYMLNLLDKINPLIKGLQFKKDFYIVFLLPSNTEQEKFIQLNDLGYFVKLVEYKLTPEISKVIRKLGVKISKEPRMIICDKWGKILCNRDYGFDLLLGFLQARDSHFFKDLKKFVIPDPSMELEERDFIEFNSKLKNLLLESKNKDLFSKINNEVFIYFRTIYNADGVKKYYIDKIKDSSAVFFNSFLHRNFYNIFPSRIRHEFKIERFNKIDKLTLAKARKIYINNLNKEGFDSRFIVKNRTYYGLGNLFKTYKIYNADYPHLSVDLEESLNKFSSMRTKIIKETRTINKRIKSDFKIYAKKHRKNLFFEKAGEESNEYWENDRRKRYLIYLNFCPLEEDNLTVLSTMLVLKKMYALKFNINFEVIFQFPELQEETELNEKIESFTNDLNIHMVDDYHVLNLYGYANPYDSEISNLFIYIDEEQNIIPFNVRDEMYLEEKLLSLIYKKVEVTKDQFRELQTISKKYFSDEFISYNEYNYRYTFQFIFDKNTFYNKEDQIVDEKYYIKGKIRMKRVDYSQQERIYNLQNESNSDSFKHEYSSYNYSPYSFLQKVSRIINDETKYKELIQDCLLYDTNNLSCHYDGHCFACKSIMKEESLTFYCYCCEAFYCPDCEKSRGGYYCLNHLLVVIVNYKAALMSKSLLSIEKYKFGIDILENYQHVNLVDTGFCCSYCDETVKVGARYICLNCRGCDVLLHTKGHISIGYIDVCEKCFDLIYTTTSGRCQDEVKNEKVRRIMSQIMEKDHHSFEEHIYIKLPKQTGSYFLY
jgi:hypothetical protein